MRTHWKAHAALFTVNLIYGINYLVAKGLMPKVIGPSGFVMLRVIGACLLFWTLMAFQRERIQTKDAFRLILCAVFGVAVNQSFFFHGLTLTSPLNASIIMTSTPIMVLIISSLLIKERITWVKLIGILVGAAGAITLILSSLDGSIHASAKGDAFILVNALSYGLYLVLVKPLMARYNAITVISWVFLIGAFLVTPFGISGLLKVQWATLPSHALGGIIYVVICTTFLAYLLNIFALKVLQPTAVSSYIYLQPVMAVLFAWFFASYGSGLVADSTNYTRDITWIMVICAMAIFIGVYLVSLRASNQRSDN